MKRSANWLESPPEVGVGARRSLWVALVAYVVIVWSAMSPYGIDASWRECDTQAIARNFLLDGVDLLRPRVDWRGDGDGAVEAEFPLYQLLVAGGLRCFGDVEWPGRVISLFSIVLATLSLQRLLEWRAGSRAALVGSLFFLASGQAVLLGARVAPDSLSIALALAGLATFVRYLSTGSMASLVIGVAACALAALQKPTALQLGLLLFGWAAVLAPQRLREPRLWIGLASMLAVVVAWLVHGAFLHSETGLTFGVVSGGDTKFPDWPHLVDPQLLLALAKTSGRYGLSLFGGAALAVLVFRRRLDAADLVLIGVVVFGLLVSLRYSHHVGMGAHYHVFATVAGAFFVARAWPQKAPRWAWGVALAAVVAHGAWQLDRELWLRSHVYASSNAMEVGRVLRDNSAPEELVIVWADKPTRDEDWQRRNNFEDPRILYHARRRGWVLPKDGLDVATLEGLVRRGARYLVDATPNRLTPQLSEWLARYGELVQQSRTVLVYRLAPST